MSLTTPINTLNNNTLYKLVVDVSRFEAGQLRLSLATNANVNLTSADVVNNQIVYYFVSGGSNYHYLRLAGSGVCDFTLDSVSIKEITTTKFFPLYANNDIQNNTLRLYNDVGIASHISLPITTIVGKSYKADVDIVTANASSGLSLSNNISVGTEDTGTSSSDGSTLTTGTFTPTGTTSYLHLRNTGTANGNEISGDPTFDNASNWTISLGNGGVDVNTTVLGKLSVVNADGTRLQKYSILTVGKLYKVTFVIDSYSSGRVRGIFDTDITFIPTAAGTYSRYFVASNTYFLVSFDLDGGANMTMTDISINEVYFNTYDNLKVREVGVSSSGFETAVNEPVVPQVPLMKYNQKMLFDGANTYLNPSLSTLSLTDDWSISVWFVANSRSANQSIIAQSASSSNRLGITINSGGNVIASMYDGSAYVNKSSTAVSVSTINHVVFTNSNKTVNLYLNGVAQTGGTNAGLNSGGSFTIGRNSLGSGAYFDGTIDDVSIFNTELTQAQIQELFNDGVALDATTHSKASALKAYWRNDGVTTWKNRGDKFASFDGVDDVITRNAINVNYKSFSVWVRPATTVTKSSGGKPIGSFITGSFSVIWIGAFASGDTDELISLYTGSTRTVWENAGDASFPNDSWTHLALVWDGSKYQIYYNGQPQTTTSNASGGHVPLQNRVF
jgi:hypothetical protein